MAKGDKAVAERIRANELEIAAFVARLEKILGDTIDTVLMDIQAGTTGAVDAARILGGIRRVLIDKGFNEEIGRLDAIFGQELKAISDDLKQYSKGKQIFGDTDKTIVEQLITFSAEDVTKNFDSYVGDIRREIISGAITGEIPAAGAIKEKYTGRIRANLEAELNTSLSAFSRTIQASKAKELGLELFIYQGPDDKITRDFCHETLDRDPPIYTVEEIAALDNGQGLDAMIYGGGYNCRHQWTPISLEKAKELGYQDGD
jgi:hypothetical protein